MQHISGTLIADATIKQLEGGKQFVSFNIADFDSYKSKDGSERVHLTTFFNCTYWLSTGVTKVLRKGTTVELIGRTSAKPYKNKEDNWTAALNFNASQISVSHYAPRLEEEEEGHPQKEKANKTTAKNNTSKAGGNNEEQVKNDLPF